MLTDREIEQGWHRTFSTSNPFCPCDLRSFTKAVRWAERATAPAALTDRQRNVLREIVNTGRRARATHEGGSGYHMVYLTPQMYEALESTLATNPSDSADKGQS